MWFYSYALSNGCSYINSQPPPHGNSDAAPYTYPPANLRGFGC